MSTYTHLHPQCKITITNEPAQKTSALDESHQKHHEHALHAQGFGNHRLKSLFADVLTDNLILMPFPLPVLFQSGQLTARSAKQQRNV